MKKGKSHSIKLEKNKINKEASKSKALEKSDHKKIFKLKIEKMLD